MALVGFVLLASWLGGIDREGRWQHAGTWVLERFTYWDSLHFIRIAEVGYLPPGLPCCDQAFFPGYPLVLRALAPLLGDSVMLAGVVVTFLGGLAASVMLWRLAADFWGGPRVGTTAVVYLAVAPYGIFLTAVYSESVFLACSVAAWWAGSHRRWWLAGALAGVAAAVRVNGLLLAAGLMVMYAVQLRSQGRWRPRPDAAALLVPLAAVGAYLTYLHTLTGSWNAWQEAQDLGWSRATAWPWTGLVAGWQATQGAQAPDVLVSRWAALLSVVAGLALLGILLRSRRWAEATYIGLSVAVLVCSTMLTSAPRYALLWFPGYLLAARWTTRPGWRWVRTALVVGCVPLLAALALSFSARSWVS